MAFFMWSQNNSGGHFHVDEDLTWRVVIQADTYGEAEYKALNLGVYYNGCDDDRDCSCCGDRWYEGQELGDDQLKDDTLVEHLQKYADEYGWEDPSIIIHYLDGTKGTITRAVKK
jgi:hypothetical protein